MYSTGTYPLDGVSLDLSETLSGEFLDPLPYAGQLPSLMNVTFLVYLFGNIDLLPRVMDDGGNS